MTRKRWLIVLGIVLTVSLVGALGASAALAQGSGTATPTPQAPTGKGPMRGGGEGLAQAGMAEIATLLGMTQDEIWAQRVLGKTIADLAKEKGVSVQTLIDALVASQKTMLDQMVLNSRMTQAQADKWLAWYQQAAGLQLTQPYGPGIGGRGGMGGFGGFGCGAGAGRGMQRGRGNFGGKLPKAPESSATPQA
jgi:lambda repressor-like predicted transcriptional regulator